MSVVPLNVRRRVQARRRAPRRRGPRRAPRGAQHPAFPAQEEQTRTDRLNKLGELNFALRACEWENSRDQLDSTAARLRSDKQIASELLQGQKELLAVRKARMKEHLTAEAEQCAPPLRGPPRSGLVLTSGPRPRRRFEAQLNEMGLALAKHRD
jgi:hypothetical protein